MRIDYPQHDVHTLSVEETIASFETNAEKGISASEANIRAERFGANIVEAQHQKSIWVMLLLQFKNPIV